MPTDEPGALSTESMAPGAQTAEPLEGSDTSGSDGQTFDKEYVSRLRKESADYRTKLRDAETRLQALERADREKQEAEAVNRGEFKRLAEARAAELEEARKAHETYRSRVVSDVQRRAVDAALSDHGVTDPEIRSALASSLLSHVTVDPETLAVSGSYRSEVKKLAEKIVGAATNGRIAAGVPGGQSSGGSPRTPREALRADIHRIFGR